MWFVRLGTPVLLRETKRRVYWDRAAAGDRNQLRRTVLGLLKRPSRAMCVGGATKLRPAAALDESTRAAFQCGDACEEDHPQRRKRQVVTAQACAGTEVKP